MRRLKLCTLLLLTGACRDVPSASSGLSALAISPPSLALRLGHAFQLRAIALSASGDTLTSIQPQWISANPALVAVDSTGRVTAIGVGRTNIRAVAAGLSAGIDVTTTGTGCVSLAIAPASATLHIGESVQARSLCVPEQEVLRWSSNNPSVAAVRSDGVITALSAGQAAVIGRLAADTSAFGAVAVTVVP